MADSVPYTSQNLTQTVSDERARQIEHGYTLTAIVYGGLALWLVLAGMYLLVYRGHPLSIDEISIFDSIESFVHHGTLARTIEFYRAPYVPPPGQPPVLQPLYEPLQIIISSPLYWLASRLPEIGQFHLVYLTNVIITALTALSLYIIALRLGFRLTVAWLGALTFGLATIALPYSRWLFREPLMGLFTLWAFYLAVAIQQKMQHGQRYYLLILPFIVAIVGMIFTKQVSVLLLPALVICLLPTRATLRRILPIAAALAAMIAVLVIVLLVLRPDFGDGRYSLERWLNPENYAWEYMLESTLGYLISPARSFWLYSPVLLLAFIGAVMLIRRGMWRLVAAVFFALLSTGAAYGALRLGTYWNGGWSWGPRYMLPLVGPFMLLVLPVLDRLVYPAYEASSAGRARTLTITRAAAGLLIAVSVGVQILALVIPYTDLYNELDQRQNQTGEAPAPGEDANALAWLSENWSWDESSIPYHLNHVRFDQLDTSWRFADAVWLPLLLVIALTGAGAVLAVRVLRGSGAKLPAGRLPTGAAAIAGGLVMVIAVSGVMLWSLRDDGRYVGSRQDVRTLISELNTAVQPDDVLFINGFEYMLQFMNWFKAGAYYAALPYPLREEYEPGEPSPTLDQLVSMLGEPTAQAVDWGAEAHDRVWLVMQSGIFTQSAMRPLEQYAALTLYPAHEITMSEEARAILFAAPPRDAVLAEAITLTPPPLFDERLHLISAEFPAGRTVDVGQLLPVTLNWVPADEIMVNYQVSVQLLNEDGELVMQRDSAPQGSFGLTMRWLPGETVIDRHAVLVPDDLPAGQYTLQIVLYDLETHERFSVRQGDLIPEESAAQITTVTINAPASSSS